MRLEEYKKVLRDNLKFYERQLAHRKYLTDEEDIIKHVLEWANQVAEAPNRKACNDNHLVFIKNIGPRYYQRIQRVSLDGYPS